jgi:molybdopterin converting factor small subunit
MITVSVRYHNMLRHRTGVEGEVVELPDGTDLSAVLEILAERHGQSLRQMLFAPDGSVSPHLVIFGNGQLLPQDQRLSPLSDGDELMLFPAISGG